MAKSKTAGNLALVDADGYLKPISKSDLDNEEGTSFGFQERLFYAFDDGAVLDYGNWEAIDLHGMLQSDYKARQVLNALVLPSLSAKKHIEPAKGDSGEADLITKLFSADDHDMLNGEGCKTGLDTIVAQMMSAVAYRRSFHEKVWTVGTGDFDGMHIYDKIAYRPQTTCRLMRHPRTGEIIGFEQDSYLSGAGFTLKRSLDRPKFKRIRSAIHIHGTWIDPLNGVSLMDVPYWAYKTKQRLMFLWFQYLEGYSLPRSAVITDDEGASKRIASSMRQAKNSGVVPVWGNNPEAIKIDTLDLSGKGDSEFLKAISFLDGCATQEILAGFLDLTTQAASGKGSYALSADGSDFFLQSGEARDRELEQSVRREIFAPFLRHNLGPKAKIPHYRIAPLTAEDKTAAISMLQSLLASRDPSTAVIPHEFIGELATSVSGAFGLDAEKIKDAFEKAAKQSAQLAAQNPAQGMATPVGQQVAAIGGVTQAATKVAAQATGQPKKGKKKP